MWTWLKLLKDLFVLFIYFTIYYQNYIQIMQINKYCHEVFFYYKYNYMAKISWQVKYPAYSQIYLFMSYYEIIQILNNLYNSIQL